MVKDGCLIKPYTPEHYWAINQGMAKRKSIEISTTEVEHLLGSLKEGPAAADYSWEEGVNGYGLTAELVDNRPGTLPPSGSPADVTGARESGR